MAGRRDVEQDIRRQLAAEAHGEVRLLRSAAITTPDASIDRLVDQAFGNPGRLTDAVALLGDEHTEAAALLRRAVRRAADPVPPAPPKPFSPPSAPMP